MSFDEALKTLKKRTEGCDLNILVWGPGKHSAEHFEKRQKIKQEVGRCFPNADIRFSEELDLSDSMPGFDRLDIGARELWHLTACDVCVVLDTSKGAGEEIAYYTRSRDAYKLLILTHQQYESSTSFPAGLRKHQNQLFYDDHQYETCNLVDFVLTRIRTVALGKLTGFTV